LTGDYFLSPNSGLMLMVANIRNHREKGWWVVPGQGLRRAIIYGANESLLSDPEKAAKMPFLERDRYYKKLTFQWLKEHPGEFWTNGVFRVLALFHFYPFAGEGWARRLVLWIFTGIILLAMSGLVLSWKRREFAWCRVLFFTITFLSFMTLVIPRYRFPLHPVFFVLAVTALIHIVKDKSAFSHSPRA
jgi:hypothetical protein